MIPKLSIIIPVYNTEKYLDRCLTSVINQSLKEIEILCINDGSTDTSLNILNNFAKKDRRIKIFNQENSGAAVARNVGLAKARGFYIGFVDSDDYVDKDYFKELFSYANAGYDIIRGIRVIGENNRHGKNEYGCIVPSIIKRSILTENRLRFPVNIKVGEDSTFKRWLYTKTSNIYECKDKGIYYHYMKREGSLSNYSKK